jgi:CRP-like cAMP-binding protein
MRQSRLPPSRPPTAAAALRDALPGAGAWPPMVLEALAGLAEWRSFDAGAHLLQAGQRAERVFLIVRGLVREYYLAADGAEHTRAFVAEAGLTGSLRDLLSAAPSVTFVQALEPTETVAWSYPRFDALCDVHPALERAARRNAERLYVRKVEREHDMLALSAGERYRRWLEAYPHLVGRVTQRHLASYLGVTPEHLSRLRRPARTAPR